VGQWVTQEAVFLATLDYFRLLAIVAATALLIVSSQAATRFGRTATRS
jgi:hypothetical protein